MAQTFEDITKDVVNRFLQNILFVDDNAYSTDKNEKNAFDAGQISSAFAKQGKLCTVFAPHSERDLSDCITLFAKSDVIVLDWFLKLDPISIENEEEDEEDDEPRGKYTKELIKGIIEDAKDEKLKLVIVYTGDGTKLHEIVKDIQSIVIDDSNFETKEDDFRVSSSNVLILVRVKSNGEGDDQLKYNKDLHSKIIEYENLPSFISEQFANFVNGLLPNYALAAISSIRNSTSNILGVFSKDIDAAFMGHFVSIPDSYDAITMLSKIFGSAVSDLVDANNYGIKLWIEKWLSHHYANTFSTTIGQKQVNITFDILKNIVESTTIGFKNKLIEAGLTIKGDEDSFKKDAIKLFDIDANDVANYKLARLMQHSDLFSSFKRRRLTMGTIVKYQEESESDWRFLLCIQQSCDSVRIGRNEERNFLFLPLVQGIKGEAVVVEENYHLFVDSKSYSIELHKFAPNNDSDTQITAQYVSPNNKYVFTDITGKRFIWIAELKEMFAQHIVSAYASQLSRVGIDNSEWIRLVGKKKSS